MSDHDLHDELERAIGHGPALPPPASRLPAARAALRRRRIAVGAVAATAAAAVVVPVAALAGGSPAAGTDPQPLAPPSSASPTAPEPTPDPTRAPYRWQDDSVPVEVDPLDPGLRIRPAAVVHERRDDLYPGKATRSAALDLTWRGERYWAVVEWDRQGNWGSIYSGPDDDFVDSFDEFVAQQVAGGGMQTGPVSRGGRPDQGAAPEPGEVVDLEWTVDGFTAGGETEVVEATDDPGLPESFAPADAPTGAAYVVMDGEAQLVLARDLGDGDPELIAVLADGHGDSLEELLAWARDRYESGEGLR